LLSFFFAALLGRLLVTGNLWWMLFGVPVLVFLGWTTKEDFPAYLLVIGCAAAWIISA
jgi:hypothetical protein